MEPIVIHSLPLLPASNSRPQQNPKQGGKRPPGHQPHPAETADEANDDGTTDADQGRDRRKSTDGIIGTVIDVEA